MIFLLTTCIQEETQISDKLVPVPTRMNQFASLTIILAGAGKRRGIRV
ncbi:hypothetical protein [Candidatus Scalindua japonica]|nr:hypothetical protein [Candidatus Scalindua japonica]